MNKKGINGSMVIAIFFGVILVGLLSFMVYNQAQQTAEFKEPIVPGEVPVGKESKASQVRVRTIDVEDPGEVQVSVPVYGWLKDSPNTVITNGISTSATAGTDTALTGYNTWQIVEFVSFSNNTYYGGKLDKDKGTLSVQELSIEDKEITNLNLDVHRIITTPLEIRISDASTETVMENDGTSADASLVNITLDSAGSTEDIDWLRFKVNETNSSFWLDSIVVDTPADSNIDSVSIDGTTELKQSISHFNDRQNFRFTPSNAPMLLRESQTYQTGTIVFKAKADVVTENVDFYFVDKQWYKSINNGIKSGVENDVETEEDIGANDYLVQAQLSIN